METCEDTFDLDTVVTFVTLVLIVLFLPLSSLVLFIRLKRLQTRRELEGGKCNLPTVLWTPRFVNYTPEDKTTDAAFSGDEIGIQEWARQYAELQTKNTSMKCNNPVRKTKMGSSTITNILPRMERLNGPYWMYATVYGVQTKVVHIAHPVPARAVLMGSGVIDIAGGCAEIAMSFERQRESCLTYLWNLVSSTFKIYCENNDSEINNETQQCRRSSFMRSLIGSIKSPAYDHFKNFSGDGVFTSDGFEWKAKRASVIHCLLRNGDTDARLENEINRAADCFEKEIQFDAECTILNVVPTLQRSTIGLIFRLLTHRSIEFSFSDDSCKWSVDNRLSHQSPMFSKVSRTKSLRRISMAALAVMRVYISITGFDRYGYYWRRQNSGGKKNMNLLDNNELEVDIRSLLPKYIEAVTKIRMLILAQSRSIWYLLPRWMYRTFSLMYWEEKKAMRSITRFARLACENAVEGSPLELLSKRRSHYPSNTISKHLLDEAITLLFAGQDTSAATLSWTLHLLSLNPQKQQKVAEEVRSVLGNNPSHSFSYISKSAVSQMQYLDAVVKESMRLYPVAPFIVRKLTSDISIPQEPSKNKIRTNDDKIITLPSSTFACIWIYALHRNPNFWHNPDDFIPERWIDPQLQSRDAGQNEHGGYIPFAIGPRNCLGQPLAHIILRIFLARILQKYVVVDPRYEAVEKMKTNKTLSENDVKFLRKDMQAGFTVLPANGLTLKLIDRDKTVSNIY